MSMKLEHRWIVFHGWFELVFESLGILPIAIKPIFRDIFGEISYFIIKMYVVYTH